MTSQSAMVPSDAPCEAVELILDRCGFAILQGVLSPADLARMRQELDRLQNRERSFVGCNELTSWQELAIHHSDSWRGRMAAAFLHAVMALSERVLFRLRPQLRPALQNRISRPSAAEGFWGRLGHEVKEACYVAAVQEAGVTRICNLLNKSTAFDICLTHPSVSSAVDYLLGSKQKLSSLNFRAALPGSGLQPLHVDWPVAAVQEEYFACNMLFVLDDFTADNGPTRVVPGSHRWNAIPSGSEKERLQSHPDEVALVAQAGSVIALNSHTWHSGTANRSAAPRRILQCYFVRRGYRPQLDQASYAGSETLARLPEAARRLLLAK